MSEGLYGLYPGLVTDIVDPDRLGRVEVRLPSLGTAGDELRVRATLLAPYAEDDQGFVAYPAVGTQVVIGFEAGDANRAYIIGSCWNGKETAPVEATRPNNKRMLKSRAGSVLEFDDTEGAPKLTVKTESGHTLVLDGGSREVRLTHGDGFGVTLTATGQVRITSNAPVDITAPAVNVHAATATFDGTVTCTTLQTTAVVSPSYTPGAGNVW
ncbi:phage baseplate assembly protein V [Streptomyces pseudogriseolus]|uniref:phage baseplate assembly protein V n=1 Tax=Streptomyces pseudogriseolus TaxID=36817 RepID=UPI000A377FA0